MKEDQNDKQVLLTQEGRDVLLQALVKKDDGGESFFSDKRNPSFKNLNVSKLMNRIKDSKGFYVINRDTMDKIIPEKENKTSGKPVTYASLKELFDWLGIKLTTLEDRYRYTKNPDKEDISTDSTENPIDEEMGGADGEPVTNLSPATKTIIDDRLSNGFVGREFVFRAFKDFIADHSNGYFTIVAEPGMGKSTIAAQYVRVRSVDVDCVCFFINYRGDNTEDACIIDICRQLRGLYGLADNLQAGANSKSIGTVLANSLQEISDYKLNNKKLVIVIDALDELEESNSSSNICLLPSTLPKNVYFLLTRRPFEESKEKLFVSPDCQKQNFQMWKTEYMEANNDDIEKYIQTQFNNEKLAVKLQNWIDNRNISQAAFVKTLTDRSNGNFMYIRYVIPAIADGIYKDVSLSELPNTLRGHYRNHVDRMYRIQTSISVSKTDRKRIIAVFLKSRDIKVSLSYISNLLELDVDEIVTPITIHFVPFFDPRDLYTRDLPESLETSNSEGLPEKEEIDNLNLSRTDIENRYQFYHKDFVDFLKKEEIEAEIQAEINKKIVKRTSLKISSKFKKSL